MLCKAYSINVHMLCTRDHGFERGLKYTCTYGMWKLKINLQSYTISTFAISIGIFLTKRQSIFMKKKRKKKKRQSDFYFQTLTISYKFLRLSLWNLPNIMKCHKISFTTFHFIKIAPDVHCNLTWQLIKKTVFENDWQMDDLTKHVPVFLLCDFQTLRSCNRVSKITI